LITTQLRNKGGHFVEPTMANFTAAAASGDWANAKNYAVNLIDQPGDKSWPIVSATFIELPKDPKDPARSAAVLKFFDWAYKSGDSIASGLEYIPLPDAVKASVRGAWRAEVKGPDGKPVM
jgi:phosphate transport system substrate-binding protein